MRKRTTRVVAVVALVIVASIVSGCRGEEHVEPQRRVTLFYEVICCSCDESPEMTRIKTDAFNLARDFDHFTVIAYDIFTTAGLDRLHGRP